MYHTALPKLLFIMTLNVLCWNVRGVMSSALSLSLSLSLSHMLDAHSVDVALITKHTSLTRSESFFSSIHSNYKTV